MNMVESMLLATYRALILASSDANSHAGQSLDCGSRYKYMLYIY